MPLCYLAFKVEVPFEFDGDEVDAMSEEDWNELVGTKRVEAERQLRSGMYYAGVEGDVEYEEYIVDNLSYFTS